MSNLRFTVRSTDLRPRTKKVGGEVFAHEQTAYVWLFDRDGKLEEFPTKTTLTIWQRDGKPEHPPYSPGEYSLHPSSFTIGDYGSLNCSPRLVAVPSAAAKS